MDEDEFDNTGAQMEADVDEMYGGSDYETDDSDEDE